MTAIRSDGGATREDAIRRAQETAEKRETELERKHREEIRAVRDLHRDEMQKIEKAAEDRVEKERASNRERLSERDARHQKEIEELRALHQRQMMRNARDAAEADVRQADRSRSREKP